MACLCLCIHMHYAVLPGVTLFTEESSKSTNTRVVHQTICC